MLHAHIMVLPSSDVSLFTSYIFYFLSNHSKRSLQQGLQLFIVIVI